MQFISTRIIFPLQDLGNIILAYREAQASLQLFDELMRKQPEYRPEEPVEIGADREAALRPDVVFRYKSGRQDAIDRPLLRGALRRHHRLRRAVGLGQVDAGQAAGGAVHADPRATIYYDDIPAKDIRLNRLRRQLGFVTQDTQLFSGTIRENMLFVKPDASDEEICAALEQAAAVRLVERTGQGLDTLLGEGGKKVSGGEKQRLSIARALLRQPRLLIFDEATSSLDSLTEEEITRTLREISAAQRQITIVIAHRLSHGHARRPHLRAGKRAHRREGHARRPGEEEGPVLRHVAPADRRAAPGEERDKIRRK